MWNEKSSRISKSRNSAHVRKIKRILEKIGKGSDIVEIANLDLPR